MEHSLAPALSKVTGKPTPSDAEPAPVRASNMVRELSSKLPSLKSSLRSRDALNVYASRPMTETFAMSEPPLSKATGKPTPPDTEPAPVKARKKAVVSFDTLSTSKPMPETSAIPEPALSKVTGKPTPPDTEPAPDRARMMVMTDHSLAPALWRKPTASDPEPAPVKAKKKAMPLAGKHGKPGIKAREAEKEINTTEMDSTESESVWRCKESKKRVFKAPVRSARAYSARILSADDDEHLMLLDSFEDLYVAEEIETSMVEPLPRVVKLDDYGIGSGVQSCLMRTPELSVKTLGKILDMQHKDGYWVINHFIERQLGIEFNVCVNTLKAAGLSSMGTRAYDGIIKVVSTGLVCWSILKKFSSPGKLPMDFRHEDSDEVRDLVMSVTVTLEKLQLSGDLKTTRDIPVRLIFEKASTFMTEEDKRQPLMAANLELGHNWVEVVGCMLEIHRPAESSNSRGGQKKEEVPMVAKTWRESAVAFEIPIQM